MKSLFIMAMAVAISMTTTKAFADVSTRNDLDCEVGGGRIGYSYTTLNDMSGSDMDIYGGSKTLTLKSVKIEKKVVSSKMADPKDKECSSQTTISKVRISGKEANTGIVVTVAGTCTETLVPGGCVAVEDAN